MNTQRITGAVLFSLTALLLGACSDDAASSGGESAAASSEPTSVTSPSDSASSVAPSATEDASGYNVVGASSGELEPGRWAITAAGSRDVPLAVLDLPAGGYGGGEYVWDNKSWVVGYWTVGGVFVDPCTRGEAFDVKSTPDIFVEALAAQQRTTTAHPAPVRLGGYDGTYVELTPPARDFGSCRGDALTIFETTEKGDHHWIAEAGVTMRYWALDVDGELVVLSGALLPGATDAQAQQLTDIVESVRFKRQ